jgi:hypothetical protein
MCEGCLVSANFTDYGELVLQRSLTLFLFVTLLVVGGGQAQKKTSPAAPDNRPPVIHKFEVSEASIYSCEYFLAVCSLDSKQRVSLRVVASDPDNDALTYQYSVTAGKLSGDGASVSWEIGNRPPGTQRATVKVTDSKDLSTSSTVQVHCEQMSKLLLARPTTLSEYQCFVSR